MSTKNIDRIQENPRVKDVKNQRANTSSNASQNRFHLLMQKKAPLRATPLAPNKKPATKKSPIPKHHVDKDEARDKLETAHLKNHEHSTIHSLSPCHMSNQNIYHDAQAIVHSAIGSGRADDINLLIKKLTLNFHAHHREARFSIATGIFEGSQFSLFASNRDLRLKVSNASSSAQQLLIKNQSFLKTSLASREINLRELTFLS